MKTQVGILDAVPAKRIFLSIIADYDLNKSICELVDNGFDEWTRNDRNQPIAIDVWLDEDRHLIRVEDNAGGLARDELRYIVGPGQSGSGSTDETIGIFGVGTKRAVVALAEDIRVRTRRGTLETYQVEFDEAWLAEDDWALPLFQVDDIEPGTTEVELQKLRVTITREAIKQLRTHLGATYARFLLREDVALRLNGQSVTPRFFDQWSYPPNYEPRRYHGQLETPSGRFVEIEVLAGLSNESSPATGEYGVYFYCNERLVAPAMKSFEVGFQRGQAGLPHPKVSLTKIIVSIRGDAGEMPWNSSKSDISTKHHVFVALHAWLVTVVKEYAALSRIWMGEWPEKVFAYSEGAIVDVPIDDFPRARRSFLPDPPPSRPRLAERVARTNQQVARQKPWVKGLYEGAVAASTVLAQPLSQGAWLAFNLLELTLQSALKEYLVNESGADLSDRQLKSLLRLVPRISNEMKGRVPLTDTMWRDIELVAQRRDALMYGRAVPTVSASDVSELQTLVRTVLRKLFEVEVEA